MSRLRALILLSALLACAAVAIAGSHVISKGDTYYSLSKKYGVSVDQIRKANPGQNPSDLKIGQKITIPETATSTPPTPTASSTNPPATYTVVKGDTLSSIARTFNTSVTAIKSLNGLSSDGLSIGQRLKITPGNSTPSTPTKSTSEPKKEPVYNFVSKVKKQIDNVPDEGRKWKYIVIHHSGSKSGNAKIFDYYHSKVRGMENGLAYHFVIGNGSESGDGEIEVGPRWKKQLQGGHMKSDEQNEVAIGICLVGNFDKTRPTRKQMSALIELITYLRKQYPTYHPKLKVHRELNIKPTDCPGELFPAEALHKLFPDE